MADVTGMLQAAAGPDPEPAQPGALVVAHPTWPYLAAYSWGPNGFRNNYPNKGFSSGGRDPGIGNVARVSLSPNENYLAMVGIGSPFVRVFPWTSTGIGNAYANPATLPVFTTTVPLGGARAATFNNAENVIAVGGEHSTVAANRQAVYAWSSSGFGAKFANPAVAIGNEAVTQIVFTPNDDAIIFATRGVSAPFLIAYAWNNTTGYGAKYADPPSYVGSSILDMAISPNGSYIALAQSSSPFISAYPFSPSTGWGAKVSNPASLPAGDGRVIAFNRAGTALALAHTTTPYCTVYAWTGSAFGTAYSSTGKALVPRNAYSVAFSLEDDYLAIGYDGNTAVSTTSSPYLKVWQWDNTTGFGNVMPDPFGLFSGFNSPANGGRLGGYGYSVVWSSVGSPLLYRDFMIVAQNRAPYLVGFDWRDYDNNGRGGNIAYNEPPSIGTGGVFQLAITNDGSHIAGMRASEVAIYPFTLNTSTTGTGGGFGTKLSGTPTFSSGNNIALNPTNTALAVTLGVSPFVRAWPWSSPFTTVGTQYASPSTAIPAFARQVTWSNNGSYIAICHNNTPYITVYEWNDSTGFGAKVANPASLAGITSGTGVVFTQNDEAIILGHFGGTGPYISAWAWSGSGFGTKYSNPATINGGGINNLRMSPKKDIVIGTSAATSYFTVGYQWSNSTGFGSRISSISLDPGNSTSNFRGFSFVEPYRCCIAFPGAPYYRLYPFDSGGWGSSSLIPTQPSSSTSTANIGYDVQFGRVSNYFT